MGSKKFIINKNGLVFRCYPHEENRTVKVEHTGGLVLTTPRGRISLDYETLDEANKCCRMLSKCHEDDSFNPVYGAHLAIDRFIKTLASLHINMLKRELNNVEIFKLELTSKMLDRKKVSLERS